MKVRKLNLLMVLTILVFAAALIGCSTTPKTETQAAAEPEFEKYPNIVDVKFVMDHITVPMAENVMIIDSRPKRAKYDKGHIPGSVSIPDSQFDKMADQLPANKDALLVFYCGGLKCPLSHKSAFRAEKLGYTNIKVFAAGFPNYMQVAGNYPAVAVEWVKAEMDKGADVVLVDSRPKKPKYDKGHIPGAISIPDSQFDAYKDQLPADKAKTLVFYCGGYKCPLSHKSAKKALAMGYTSVKVFDAGYPGWVAYVGKDSAAKTAAIKSGGEEGSIDNDLFTRIVNEDPGSITLIDVRDPAEFATGSFKTAVNIPVDQLEAKIPNLPSTKPIVFVCGTGARSGEAYYMVQDVRPELKEVYYVEAEIAFNQDGSFKLTKAAQ
jgi:rhodanese-related sulfurtransferase